MIRICIIEPPKELWWCLLDSHMRTLRGMNLATFRFFSNDTIAHIPRTLPNPARSG